MEAKFQLLIAMLEEVAKANKDEFLYSMEFNPGCASAWFHFIARERADRHIIVEGSGMTIEEALQEAEDNIEEACESWDYKFPKKTIAKLKSSAKLHPMAIACVQLKDHLGRAKLYKTMQAMEAVVTSVGWEIAEQQKS